MRKLIINYLHTAREYGEGFNPNSMRWHDCFFPALNRGEKQRANMHRHYCSLDFNKLSDEDLLVVYTKVISRQSMQM